MPKTPTTNEQHSSQQTKRKLMETSPEIINMAKKPVGNMEVGELMSMMKITMNSILEEKLENLPTKQDMEEVKAGIVLASSEIADLKAENKKLKEEIEILKRKMELDGANLRWFEHQINNTKLIFKEIPNEKPVLNAVLKICTENLKITPKIISAKTIFQKQHTQSAIVEFENEDAIKLVLRNTKHLAGTKISIERDLNPRRQRNKVAMLLIRKKILEESQKHKIMVRDDKLKVKDKWFTWTVNGKLVCGRENAEVALKMLYGNELQNVSFDNIFEQIDSKN